MNRQLVYRGLANSNNLKSNFNRADSSSLRYRGCRLPQDRSVQNFVKSNVYRGVKFVA